MLKNVTLADEIAMLSRLVSDLENAIRGIKQASLYLSYVKEYDEEFEKDYRKLRRMKDRLHYYKVGVMDLLEDKHADIRGSKDNS